MAAKAVCVLRLSLYLQHLITVSLALSELIYNGSQGRLRSAGGRGQRRHLFRTGRMYTKTAAAMMQISVCWRA